MHVWGIQWLSTSGSFRGQRHFPQSTSTSSNLATILFFPMAHLQGRSHRSADGSLEVRQLQGLLIPGAQPDAGGVKLKLGGAPGWACPLVLCGQVGYTVSLELLCWLSDGSFFCLYENKAMWLCSLSNAVVEGECFYVLATRGHCRGAADQPMGRGKLPAV